MEFICARVSGKDEGTGIEDGDWERADEGFVFETIDASCSWRLVGIVAEVGGGRWRKHRDDVFIFCLIWLFDDARGTSTTDPSPQELRSQPPRGALDTTRLAAEDLLPVVVVARTGVKHKI